MTRVDCHVHIGASDTGQIYYPQLEGDEWLHLAQAAGLDWAVAFPPTIDSGYSAANRKLRDWAAEQGGRVKVLARLGGRRIPLAEPRFWLVRRAARRRIVPRPADLDENELSGFAGVKVLPQLDGIPDVRMFEAIAALRLPVLSHAGRFVPASWLARVVLPRITGPLILAHLGAFPAEADLIDEALELAASDPRVYLDTSGIWETPLLERALDRVPEKLMFGSDCPLTHPAVAMDQVARRVADEGLRARIMGDLAEEVFA